MTSSGVQSPRYLWIRLALFEKQLAAIIDYLVQNSRYSATSFRPSNCWKTNARISSPLFRTLAQSLYFGKMKAGLWDHLAMCISVCASTSINFECLNQSFWILVCILSRVLVTSRWGLDRWVDLLDIHQS
jgi:hypothetical protein